MAAKFHIFCFLILLTVHQLVPLAMAAPISEHATTRFSSVGHAGIGVIAGGSTSGMGGGGGGPGGKKPRKVMQSRGFEGRKMSQVDVGGSHSRHGGSGIINP